MTDPDDPYRPPPGSGGIRPDGAGLVQRLDDVFVRLDALRHRPALTFAVAGVALAVVAAGWWAGRAGRAGPIEASIPLAPSVVVTEVDPAGGEAVAAPEGGPSGSVAAEPGNPILVHVAGSVAEPGIVTLPDGARVVDAVEAAGGPDADADLDQLNLAAPLVDGIQIRVPAEGEILAPTGPGPAGPLPPAGPLDLNTATAAQLDDLPGIGPTLAAAVVAWRDDHGRFASVDELLDVPGIGPAKLDALVDLVTV
ncbi:MAG: helix-hairpin-helix domain-containing protein [Acidimicrobiales bacterium]